MMDRIDVHTYFMNLVRVIALRSTCKRRQIGTVLVDSDNRVISTGYNGAPVGLDHCLDIGCMRDEHDIRSGTEIQFCRAVHAEQNALLQAGYNRLNGCKCYVSVFPCSVCTKMLINVGVSTIIFDGNYPDDLAKQILDETDVKIWQYGK